MPSKKKGTRGKKSKGKGKGQGKGKGRKKGKEVTVELLNRAYHLNTFDVVCCSKSKNRDKEALANTKIGKQGR